MEAPWEGFWGASWGRSVADNYDLSSILSQVQGILNPQPQGQGLLAQALGPYGGATNVGLNLLANGGPSPIPRSFGQIVGQSALQAQQVAQQSQTNALQRQLMAMQIAQGALGLGTSMQRLNDARQMFGGGAATPATPATTEPPPSDEPPPLIRNYTAPAQFGASTQTDSSTPAVSTPSQAQIDAASRFAMLGPNANPLDIIQKRQELEIQAAQRSAAPRLASFDNVVKSDSPTRLVSADPQLQATWSQVAKGFGIDPVSGFNDNNVRLVFGLAGNQIRGQVGLPTQAPTLPVKQEGISQYDPITGKLLDTAPTDKYILPSGKVVELTKAEGVARGLTPYSPFSVTAAQMEGPIGQLDAALTAAGVNIPGGRSGQQRLATLGNLIKANPGMSPQDIAQMVRTGQLDFNGAKRSTGQLSTLAAAADVQSRKIEKDLASLGPIIQNLPGGPATLASWMTNLQKNWSWNGDKNSTEAIGYIKELAGEYAKLVSGSTGMAAPAEGEMKSALGLMQSALTENGYTGMKDFLSTTSQNRRDAVKEGLQSAAASGAGVGQGPKPPKAASALPPVNAKGWTLHMDKNGVRAYVSPDGKSYELAK